MDISWVICPSLIVPVGGGSIRWDIEEEKDSIVCIYTCPANTYFIDGDTPMSNKSYTCDNSTAEWSHHSISNPFGDLPNCAGTETPEYLILQATIKFSGTTSCPTNATVKGAVNTTLSSDPDPSYSCLDDTCFITDVTCSSANNGVTITITINQTSETDEQTILLQTSNFN